MLFERWCLQARQDRVRGAFIRAVSNISNHCGQRIIYRCVALCISNKHANMHPQQALGICPTFVGVQLICVFHGGLGRGGGAFDGCGQLCGSSRQAQHSQGINTVAVQGNPRQCQQQKWGIKCKTITWDEILNILQVWSLNFLSTFVCHSAVGPCQALLWVHIRWLTPVVKEDWSNTRQWWTRSQTDKTTNECLCGEVPDFGQMLFGGFGVVSRFGAGDV